MVSLLTAAAALLVFCAPGYPGAGGDAQPLVDEFAAAATKAAGLPEGSLAAVYDADEKSDLARLARPDAVLAFVPWPFYVQHGAELHLTPLVQADVLPVGTVQRWTLVARSGHAPPPAGLAGVDLISTAGYAPAFVRAAVSPGVPLPANLTITASGQVLSGLRRAVNGEPVVLLLDQEQSAALPGLPFAAQLQTIATSRPVPVALIAVVGNRLPARKASAIKEALLKLASTPDGAATLGRLRLKGFVTPDLPAAGAP